MHVRSSLRSRRGTVQILYALLFFGICGIAGVVIDLGSARHTQVVMQSAADSAAMEGMRFRDATVTPDVDPDDDAPDCRTIAAASVSKSFTDADLGDGRTIRYGAGPVYILDESGFGPPELAAAQTLRLPAPADRVSRPRLERNRGANLKEGDIVAGNYAYQATSGPVEDADYTRNDGFVPSATGDALLVRLRRSDSVRDPLAREAGVSSSGPTLPFLFARGSLIQPSTSGYNPRTDGITVRATAIAQAVPAKTAGPFEANTGTEGLAPFALTLTYWTTPIAGPITVEADGRLTIGGATIGQCVDSTRVVTVGRSMIAPFAIPGPPALAPTELALANYVPIYDTFGAAGDRLIGFGLVRIESLSPPTFDRLPRGTAFPSAAIPLRNVSAAVLQGAGNDLSDPALSPQLDAVFSANANLRIAPSIVLAPVLVR